MKIEIKEGIEIYDELQKLKDEGDLNKTFVIFNLLEKKWVAVIDILQRMRNARVSKGYLDNYMAIETELENAIKGQ